MSDWWPHPNALRRAIIGDGNVTFANAQVMPHVTASRSSRAHVVMSCIEQVRSQSTPEAMPRAAGHPESGSLHPPRSHPGIVIPSRGGSDREQRCAAGHSAWRLLPLARIVVVASPV